MSHRILIKSLCRLKVFVSILLFHDLLVEVNEGKRHFTEIKSSKTSKTEVSWWKM